jgi:hypothetical protein
MRIWLDSMWWVVREIADEPGYEAKIVLDEE